MAINLQKGQRASLSQQKFTVGLGWDTNAFDTGAAFDLDASVFVLNSNAKLLSDNHFVFYNNAKDPNEAVIHSGDNTTGAGDGDDETIQIDLSRIDASAQEICIVVTIHDGDVRRQNFGQVRNAFIRVIDPASGTELMKYDLDEDFSVETAVEFGRLYKRGDEWKFEAIGSGYKGGLEYFLNKYN
ncbi:TerD family protein [Spirosoma luteolum]